MIVGAMLLVAAGVQKEPVALEATSKWYVLAADGGCTLARTYAGGGTKMTVTWRATPLQDKYLLTMLWPDKDQHMYRGAVDLILTPGAVQRWTFESFPTMNKNERAMQVMVLPDQFGGLPARATMSLTPSQGNAWSVPIDGAGPAFDALAACGDATLKEWGVDRAERDAVEFPPVINADWVGPGQYPERSSRDNAQGATVMLYTLGVDGHASDCRIVGKSGSDELDQTSCRALTKGARFTPARDRAGRPVSTHQTLRINWVLPDMWKDDSAYTDLLAQEQREQERKDREQKAAIARLTATQPS